MPVGNICKLFPHMVHIESNFLFLWNWHTDNPQIHVWQSAVIRETFAKTSQRVRGITEKNLWIWNMVMSDAISLQTQLKQTVRTLPLCNYVRLATWELLVFFVTTIGILGVIGYLPLCVSMYVCFARSTNVYIIHRYQSVPWAWYNMSQGHCTDDMQFTV